MALHSTARAVAPFLRGHVGVPQEGSTPDGYAPIDETAEAERVLAEREALNKRIDEANDMAALAADLFFRVRVLAMQAHAEGSNHHTLPAEPGTRLTSKRRALFAAHD